MLGGLLACLIGAAPLQAAPYPDRPITIFVPFGKGTTADLIAAVVSEAMSKNIGQKVTVELKPGAGGGIAMEQVEKAAPDGYTLAMITQGTHVFNLSLYKTLRYDPQKIMPITPIAAVSNVTTVHPSNPANTPLEVAAAARAARASSPMPPAASAHRIIWAACCSHRSPVSISGMCRIWFRSTGSKRSLAAKSPWASSTCRP
jgi:tripartite-type tricarboxylate transporter receptor subunit TctC